MLVVKFQKSNQTAEFKLRSRAGREKVVVRLSRDGRPDNMIDEKNIEKKEENIS